MEITIRKFIISYKIYVSNKVYWIECKIDFTRRSKLKKHLYLTIFPFILLITSIVIPQKQLHFKDHVLRVHFIDVGQGDSTLITIGDKSLLIDSGEAKASEKLIKYLKKQGIKKLNHVVATHPHEDHMGGMELIIDNFKIENFWAPKVTVNTRYFNRMIDSLKRKSLRINVAKEGKFINLHPNVQCKILSPTKDNYDNLNNYSSVIYLKYGQHSFLFMGDSDTSVEQDVLERNSIQCDILKLGHHGSTTSSGEVFLDKILPQLAIASCGKNNSFNHPSKKVINKLQTRSIKLYRTDIHGDIVFESNGQLLKKLY